jgi:hypothetical protein
MGSRTIGTLLVYRYGCHLGLTQELATNVDGAYYELPQLASLFSTGQ